MIINANFESASSNPKEIVNANFGNQISYVIEGYVSKDEMFVEDIKVRAYLRSTGELLSETLSLSDGYYKIEDLESQEKCYVIAVSQYEGYNSVIKDKIIPNVGMII